MIPQTAQAQTFVCPNGPGPGERQVGMTGGGNGVAPVPVCVGDGPAPPPPPQMRWVNNYFAAAWHPGANDAWIAAGFQNKGRADAAALAACNRAMGGGCTLAISNMNGAVVIARGVEGGLYVADHAKKGGAEKNVQQYCREKGDECVVINWVTVTPGQAPVGQSVREDSTVYEPRGNFRRAFGAIAWVGPDQRGTRLWAGDIWYVGGRDSWDKASADALALCQKDVPVPCKTVLVGSDVFVAVVERDGNWITAASGASADLAGRRAMAECKKAKGKCRIAATIDLSRNESLRFDAVAQGQPYFSAQAWTKDSVAPWQNSVWSVTGAKDAESAKAGALAACRKESKLECELALESFNGRVAHFIDQNGNIRLKMLERDVDPAAVVQSLCAEKKVSCRLAKVVDTRVPMTERIEVK